MSCYDIKSQTLLFTRDSVKHCTPQVASHHLIKCKACALRLLCVNGEWRFIEQLSDRMYLTSIDVVSGR